MRRATAGRDPTPWPGWRHLQRDLLSHWTRSYRREERFDGEGRPVGELLELPPRGDRRISANPKTNGGSVLVDLRLLDFRQYGVDVPRPGVQRHELPRVPGRWVKDVVWR